MNSNYRKSSRKRRVIIFISTVLFLVSLIVTSKGNNKILFVGESIIGGVTTPITKAVYFTSSKVIDALEFLFGSTDMRKENAKLNTENIKLKEQIANLEKVIDNEDFLKEEYDLIKNDNKNYLKSYIIGMDSSNIYDRFSVDKGSVQGVKKHDTVFQGVVGENDTIVKGLIGTISEVGASYSKVSSITDSTSGISFKTSRTGELGKITGGNKEKIKGTMYKGTADIVAGDAIYTSGLGGIYPPDLYIGKVIEVKKDNKDVEKTIVIESPVDFNNLYRVLILKNEQVAEDE